VTGAVIDHGLVGLMGFLRELFALRDGGVDTRIVAAIETVDRRLDPGDGVGRFGDLCRRRRKRALRSGRLVATPAEIPQRRGLPFAGRKLERVIRDRVEIGRDAIGRQLGKIALRAASGVILAGFESRSRY